MAAEFVRRRVAVIVCFQGTVTAEAAKAATSTIPILFQIGTDPVAIGLVASLNRPGGNLTGATDFSIELQSKHLELLHDLVPGLTTLGILINPENPTPTNARLRLLESAAPAFGLRIYPVPASHESEFDSAFEMLARAGAGALLVTNDPFHVSRRERIAALAARTRIPTLYSPIEFAQAGGLMSYGGDSAATFVVLGDYAGRILKGEKPADLPVVQPTKFQFVINLKAAKALDLAIPPTFLAIADEVIE
jgi:putative ABC transport system substrate-binding protein